MLLSLCVTSLCPTCLLTGRGIQRFQPFQPGEDIPTFFPATLRLARWLSTGLLCRRLPGWCPAFVCTTRLLRCHIKWEEGGECHPQSKAVVNKAAIKKGQGNRISAEDPEMREKSGRKVQGLCRRGRLVDVRPHLPTRRRGEGVRPTITTSKKREGGNKKKGEGQAPVRVLW